MGSALEQVGGSEQYLGITVCVMLGEGKVGRALMRYKQAVSS